MVGGSEGDTLEAREASTLAPCSGKRVPAAIAAPIAYKLPCLGSEGERIMGGLRGVVAEDDGDAAAGWGDVIGVGVVDMKRGEVRGKEDNDVAEDEDVAPRSKGDAEGVPSVDVEDEEEES